MQFERTLDSETGMPAYPYVVEGLDGFDPDADYYFVSEHRTLPEARIAAVKRKAELAESQSGAGGDSWGIQDRTYIVHPDGRREKM